MDVSLFGGPQPVRLGAAQVRPALAADAGLVWLDFDHSEAEGMRLLRDLIDVRAADLADCHARAPVPKLHAYGDHYASAINGLVRGSDQRLYFQPLKIFFTERLLVTVMGPTSAALEPEAVRRDLAATRRHLGSFEPVPTSAFEVVGAIRLEMLRSQQELVADLAARVAELEKSVMGVDPVKAELVLVDLFELRHDLQTIRTNAAQTLELYVHLTEVLDTRDGVMPLDRRRLGELRMGFSHLRNTVDLEREYLQEVLELLQTRVSTELNRFVRKITAWGTIGIAWTVIVGIYGMNFAAIPGLESPYGFATILGVMALVGGGLAAMFHRRGWM